MKIPTPQELIAAHNAQAAADVEAAMAAIVPKMKGCPPITIHVSVPEHARDGVRKRFEVAGWTITFEGHYYAPDPYEWIVLRPQRAPTLLDALSAEVGGCNHPLVRSPERS